MTGINALSTRRAIKSLEDGISSVNAQPGTDSAAMMFAAIFDGWLNQIGQGQDSGNQSNEPAGKEANSGHHALLGLDGLQGLMGILQGNGDLQEVFLQGQEEQTNAEQLKTLLTQLDNLRSQNTQINPLGIFEEVQLSGMTEQPQGKDSPRSELDLYKNVISNLLKEMSGEIRVKQQIPAEFNPLTQQKSEIAAQRYTSGLFIAMEGEEGQAKIAQTAMAEKHIAQPLRNQAAVEAPLSQTENQSLISQRVSQTDIAVVTQPNVNQVKMAGNNVLGGPGNSEAVNVEQGNSEDIEVAKSEASRGPSTNGMLGDKLAERGLPFSKEVMAKGIQENDDTKESYKAKAFSTDLSLEGTGLNQIKDINQVQGKVPDKSGQPVWSQIAQEIFDKAYQARPQLREMTIHLHPAELGKIDISMSWEEGQVHLRMVASEAGTGQMLQSNLAELRDNLTQLGIQCGQMEMGLGEQKESPQEHQGREGSARSQENRDESLDFQNGEELLGILTDDDRNSDVNRINVTA